MAETRDSAGLSSTIERLARAVALLAVLCVGATHAGSTIYCGCSLPNLQPCESGFPESNPTCQLSFFEIGGTASDLDAIQSVRWFQDEESRIAFPDATSEVRSVAPWSMSPNPSTPVNCSALIRTDKDPVGYKFVSAVVTKKDGGTDNLKAKFTFTTNAPLAPTPAGITRVPPPPACPAASGTLHSPCNPNSSWPEASAPTPTWAEFVDRLDAQCEQTTLTISRELSFTNVLVEPGKDGPLQLRRSGVQLVAPSGVSIDFAALQGACGIAIYAGNVTMSGFTLSNKAGLCVCGSANTAAPNGVQIAQTTFRGAFANLRVDPGAVVNHVHNSTCEAAMEVPCIVNAGTIVNITDVRFDGGMKGGAIHNYQAITLIADNQFTNMKAEIGDCSQAAGVVLNAGGASITRVRGNTFTHHQSGAAIWNDGTISDIGPHNTFSNYSSGGVTNGPTGNITGRVNSNSFSDGKGSEGCGILNYGTIQGAIEDNTFTNMYASAGAVIANVQPGSDAPVCFGGAQSIARLVAGVINNRLEVFDAGNGCGGIYNGPGGLIGAFDTIWAAITSADYLPDASVTNSQGISGNVLRNGTGSDSGVGICNAGKVSVIDSNTVESMETSDSAGGLYLEGTAAFVGRNIIRDTRVSDVGSGIFCGNPAFTSDRVRAVVKLLKANAITGAKSAGEGGCIYGDQSCAVQFLQDNTCSAIKDINPPAAGEPVVPIIFENTTQPVAVLCSADNNQQLDATPQNLTISTQGLLTNGCPFLVLPAEDVKNGRL